MKLRYIAHISKELQNHCFADIIEIPSLADATDGFWINAHGVFARDDDNMMWIPASQILYVMEVPGNGLDNI